MDTTLRDLLRERGIRTDAAALLVGRDKATISRIATGKTRAQPETVIRLAKALGMSVRRTQAVCDASWAAAHSNEAMSA